jgi:hypothetical protein
MALTNVLVQQSIANEGQPKALLVDARGQPLITDSKDLSNKSVGNEEAARETSLNIQKMVDLLEVIAMNVTNNSGDKLEENKPVTSSFGEKLGFYGSMLISSLFSSLFKGIAAASRFIIKGVIPFLAKGFGRIIVGFFGFLAGLPAGLAAAVIGGITVAIAGFVRGIKDAFAMYKSGGGFFDIIGAFVEGFFKGALNFVFGVVDWVANLFGLDLPDNLGDIIVNGIKSFFGKIADYISGLPARFTSMLTGFLNNIGIPEFKVLGVSVGPFYPFRKTNAVPPMENTVGPEKSPIIAPTPKNVPGLNSDRTIDPNGEPSKVPVIPISPVINKSVTGESVNLPRSKMSKEEAKTVIEGHPKIKEMQAAFDEAEINGTTVSRKQVENILSDADPKFKSAFETLYRADLEKMFAVNESVETAAKNKGISSEGLRKMRQAQTIETIEASKSASLSVGTPSDIGNTLMASSAEAESAKSSASSNIVISSPSSTINAPKESNLISTRNVRNDENTLSKYVGSLYGSNI